LSPRIQRLRAEIRSDREAISRWLAELDSLTLDGNAAPATLSLAAWALHHAYSAIEAILERTMRTVEGDLPEGVDHHRALLEAARLDIEGIRPPLLSQETVSELHELRAFRHFVRHAYAVGLDGTRLSELRDHAVALAPQLDTELEALDAWLAEVSRAYDE